MNRVKIWQHAIEDVGDDPKHHFYHKNLYLARCFVVASKQATSFKKGSSVKKWFETKIREFVDFFFGASFLFERKKCSSSSSRVGTKINRRPGRRFPHIKYGKKKKNLGQVEMIQNMKWHSVPPRRHISFLSLRSTIFFSEMIKRNRTQLPSSLTHSLCIAFHKKATIDMVIIFPPLQIVPLFYFRAAKLSFGQQYFFLSGTKDSWVKEKKLKLQQDYSRCVMAIPVLSWATIGPQQISSANLIGLDMWQDRSDQIRSDQIRSDQTDE